MKRKKPEHAMCPVCGEYDFKYYDTYEICPVCHWENDGTQTEYPDSGGANRCILNERRAQWNSAKKE